MSEKKVLVLFSGGSDSLLLLDWAMERKYRTGVLLIHYGQAWIEEMEYAEALLEMMKTKHAEGIETFSITLPLGHNIGQASYPGVHEKHVPGRNGVFLSFAMHIAESGLYDEIWIGCDFSDRENLFPDCYQEWIYHMNEVAKRNGSRPLLIKAPLLGWHKQDVLNELKRRGHDLRKVYSGYSPPTDNMHDEG